MYITEEEVENIFNELGIKIVDNECDEHSNHINTSVFKYLEKKYTQPTSSNNNINEIKKEGEALLKVYSDTN